MGPIWWPLISISNRWASALHRPTSLLSPRFRMWTGGNIFQWKDAVVFDTILWQRCFSKTKKWFANQPQPTKICTKSAYLKLPDVFKVQKKESHRFPFDGKSTICRWDIWFMDTRGISISIAMLDHQRVAKKCLNLGLDGIFKVYSWYDVRREMWPSQRTASSNEWYLISDKYFNPYTILYLSKKWASSKSWNLQKKIANFNGTSPGIYWTISVPSWSFLEGRGKTKLFFKSVDECQGTACFQRCGYLLP